MKLLAGTKTITTIQAGGIYKERWTCPAVADPFPADATATTTFKDSAGGDILTINGTFETPIPGGFRHLTFLEQPETMENVPNGAGFEVIVTDSQGPNYFKYGTVFRRQNFFPHSPAELVTYEPKRYTDTFQRPPGAIGGRWRTMLGQPRIFDNTGSIPNSVGPNWNFFSRYCARFNWPFNGDSIDLSISAVDKGSGKTLVGISSNSDCSSYLYVMFDSSADTVTMGIGHGPDINTGANFDAQAGPTALVVPSAAVANYKLRFDEATKDFTMYNSDFTTQILTWNDADDLVPHGKGYRYFLIAGNSGIFDSGVQIAYISAANIV